MLPSVDWLSLITRPDHIKFKLGGKLFEHQGAPEPEVVSPASNFNIFISTSAFLSGEKALTLFHWEIFRNGKRAFVTTQRANHSTDGHY